MVQKVDIAFPNESLVNGCEVDSAFLPASARGAERELVTKRLLAQPLTKISPDIGCKRNITNIRS